MTLLALDTTSRVATAALIKDGACVLERSADETKKHAETALPLVELLLQEAGVSLNEVKLFAVNVGPGSFTGVRIGVSTINAMAFALNRRVVPIDALYALYASVGERKKPVCALIDARNGNAYAALYQAGKTLVSPAAVELAPYLKTLPCDTVFVGDVHAGKETLPSAKFIGLSAYALRETAKESVMPLYLRASQAERLHAEGLHREAKKP